MRIFSALLLSVFLLISCRTPDDGTSEAGERITVSGKIVNEITGEPAANYTITLVERHYSGTGFLSTVQTVTEKTAVTGADGTFSMVFPVKDRSNAFEFRSFETAKYTPIQNSQTAFCFKQLTQPKMFNVRNWERLEITVQNIIQFDDEDEIRVSLLEQNTAYQGFFIDSIRNHGIKNIPLDGSYDDGKYPRWIGKNVNSTIYARLQNGSNYRVFWDMKREGKWTYYHKSDNFETVDGTVNSYNLKY